MNEFRLIQNSVLPPNKIFEISVDIKNFHHILPNYFTSLKIIKNDKSEKIVIEKIKFLGFGTTVKTKHVIIPPNLHHVFILSGPLKGSFFIESYKKSDIGTAIIIDVYLKFFGFMNGFSFLNNYIIKRMSSVMVDFIKAAEIKVHSENFNND
ncbi:hypothetical protein Nlim_0051 [Candidatus Nitrosarchaeum limnium SFB1]|uniref:Coenzyme Q-binding protein COQ10 START domain-containing protein n=1 Tax=Candidatus Nitrosarchaeum limnium SFB1 TaxID=886738 RepID=F3KHW0_9ARCH|nr:hypothetical protein Nlim_0051 [Candidatus Nitrosarchaeum limnium SFB1]